MIDHTGYSNWGNFTLEFKTNLDNFRNLYLQLKILL